MRKLWAVAIGMPARMKRSSSLSERSRVTIPPSP